MAGLKDFEWNDTVTADQKRIQRAKKLKFAKDEEKRKELHAIYVKDKTKDSIVQSRAAAENKSSFLAFPHSQEQFQVQLNDIISSTIAVKQGAELISQMVSDGSSVEKLTAVKKDLLALLEVRLFCLHLNYSRNLILSNWITENFWLRVLLLSFTSIVSMELSLIG